MDLNRQMMFVYGRDAEGKISITGTNPTVEFGDSNEFHAQRGMQDVILAEIRDKVGIPTGLSALWKSADPAKILPAIAELEDPRHMMMALHSISSSLPEGMKPLLDKIGAGTEDFRTALQSALKNPEFQKQLLTQTGGTQFAKSLEVLNGSQELLEKNFGLDEAGVQAIIAKVGTDIFTRIGTGEFNAKFDQLEGAIQEAAIITAASQKMDSIAETNPGLANMIGIIKADPDLMFSIGRAAALDPTVSSGLQTMLEGNGGIDMARLEKLFSDPVTGAASRTLLKDMLDVVAKEESVTFSTVVDFTQKMEKGDMAGASKILTNIGMEVPPQFAAAQQFDQIKVQLAAFGKTEAGAGIMGFLRDALGPNGFLGKLLESFGMGGLRTQLAGFFQAPAETTTATAVGKDGKIGNFSTEEFNERFTRAMEGRSFKDSAHVRAALTEVDPDIADKYAGMDATTRNSFNAAVESGTTLEQITAAARRFTSDLSSGQTVKHAVDSMAPAVG